METVLNVTGMTCQGCVKSVTRVLSALPDVSQVNVSLEQGRAVVEHGPQATVETLRQAVEDAGFGAS